VFVDRDSGNPCPRHWQHITNRGPCGKPGGSP
jgi:hypothetical protein